MPSSCELLFTSSFRRQLYSLGLMNRSPIERIPSVRSAGGLKIVAWKENPSSAGTAESLVLSAMRMRAQKVQAPVNDSLEGRATYHVTEVEAKVAVGRFGRSTPVCRSEACGSLHGGREGGKRAHLGRGHGELTQSGWSPAQEG